MKENGVTQYLSDYSGKAPVRLHMPGHKGASFYKKYGYGKEIQNLADFDITEITGADNKFQPEGIIRETMAKYEKLYDVDRTFLLVNGTSGGIIASILAAVEKGKKLILARNSHKSVFSALALGDIEPVYAYPEVTQEYGISGEIKAGEVEKLLENEPDAQAVILPSPNYYGICSDIKRIADIVHEKGKILIVDQAHGAHLSLFSRYGIGGLPLSAEEQGADIVINSTHKTLATFTQSAIMNVKSGRVDMDLLEEKLGMIESTSPSYILMASHDMNAEIIKAHGNELFRSWKENIDRFYREAVNIKGLDVMDSEMLDRTKLNVSMRRLGYNGEMLEKELMKRGIYIELTAGDLLMGMTGIGTSESDIDRFLEALDEIASSAEEITYIADKRFECVNADFGRFEYAGLPEKTGTVDLSDAAGMICASQITPYPPGIPFICPGERLMDEAVKYLTELRKNGRKVIGINEKLQIKVGK